MIWQTHQKMREFCLTSQQVKDGLVASVSELIHCGRPGNLTFSDISEIIKTVSGGTYQLISPTSQQRPMEVFANETYMYNLQLAQDFGDLIIAFDLEYDRISRKKGTLTYIDIAYLVWLFTFAENNEAWRQSLKNRFNNLLIDEFQDTNFVQYQVLSSLIRDGSTEQRNRIMFIGDVKQSIYTWRSAEPQIFNKLINDSINADPNGIATNRYGF